MASDFSIRHAAHIIRLGGVIAYPTETVYGLGCDIYNPSAVEKINQIKQRPHNKQFILLCGELDQIKSLIEISPAQEGLISSTSEPTSWVISASALAPTWLVDKDETLTVRISQNQLVKRLCAILNQAIISTSANLSGQTPAKNSLTLHKTFQHSVDKILVSNQKLVGRPSKIIRLCDNHIIRH